MQKTMKWLLAPVALVTLAACGQNDQQPQIDDALRNDLSLASQAPAYAPQQFVSPYEMGYGAQPYGAYPPQYQQPYGYYPQPAYPPPQPVAQRAPTVRRIPASTSRSTGTVRQEPIRHTKRDAILGAAAGAAIGAATSRDKLKGAVIGAAAGGVLGAIVGHTIDVEYPR